MTAQVPAADGRFKFGAIAGIALIAAALLIAVPVAVNFPESWVGAVLVLGLAGIGVALVVTHLKLGHRGQRRHKRKGGA